MVWQKGGAKGSFLQRALEGAVVNALGLANYNRVQGKVRAKALAKSTARRVQSRGRRLFHLLLGGLPTGQGSSRHMGRKGALPLLQASIRHRATTATRADNRVGVQGQAGQQRQRGRKREEQGQRQRTGQPRSRPYREGQNRRATQTVQKGQTRGAKSQQREHSAPPSL